MEKNPFLQQENYFEPYNESVENLKNNPKILELDKVCYELFESQELGRKFMEIVQERFLLPALASRGSATYQIDVLWQEGFKDFARMIMTCVNSHKQRIQAELK